MPLIEEFNGTRSYLEQDMREAAMHGQAEKVGTFLSEGGIDPNAVVEHSTYKVDFTPAIVLAAASGHKGTLTRLLNDDRTDPNLADPFGRTALQEAVFHNETSMVRGLAGHPKTDMTALLDDPANRVLSDIVLYDRQEIAGILGGHPKHGTAILKKIGEIASAEGNSAMAGFCKSELKAGKKKSPSRKPRM